MSVHVFVLTHFVSPYQRELFDALAREGRVKLEVFYLHQRHHTRDWTRRDFSHDAHFLDADQSGRDYAFQLVRQADICIIGFYFERLASQLLRARAAMHWPWIFWGERPGFHTPPILGQMLRRWTLRALHRSSAPIWGIGRWAVERYRKEFGDERHYADVPYYSNLIRFGADSPRPSHKCVFLFSGSITKRKGVDLLAKAFVDLAQSHPHVELIVLGAGEYLSRMKKTLSGLADRVQFLGFKDWHELPQVYHSAHFLCAPSRYDGWAIVVPEALAAGLPVISTDRTGAAIEFIETGKNGWLIRAGNFGALTQAMREAADLSPTQRQKFSANARATVARHQLNDGVRKIMTEIEFTLANWPDRAK